MACSNVFDAFAVATESLDQDVYLRASHRSVMLNLVPRGEYKSHTGLTQTTFTIGKQEPADDEETWNAITLTSGSTTSACTTSWNDALFGYNADTYSPETFDLRGPVICKDDLIFDHNPAVFLDKYLRSISIRAQRSWDNRLLKLYIDFSRKAIADASFTVGAAEGTMTQDISTSALTQEMLDEVALELIESGATDPDTQGWINLGNDGPVFPMLIGLEMSNQIATNNAAFRQDWRDSDSGKGAGSMLLKRVGATRVIKNFRHIPWIYPARYTYNGTAYVRVNTWDSSAGTKGFVSTLNDDWKTAPYEAAVVLNPHVFTSEVVKPVNALSGLSWNPSNYMGEWEFKTGSHTWDTDCPDPLMKYGRHFAQFKHAARPEFPEYGVTVIFKRCPQNSFTPVYCT